MPRTFVDLSIGLENDVLCDAAGAMIELTASGRNPLTLDAGNGAPWRRSFLQDGDAVILKDCCAIPGHARIGFGENRGTVLPAISR